MKIKYSEPVRCDNPCWELSQGKFRNETAVYRAYEARAKALDYEILEVKERD
jgi:hypothetical protein